MDSAAQALERKRLYNKEYHKRRWEIDADYREKKRAAAIRQRAHPECNLRRRQKVAESPELREIKREQARQWALAFPERVKNYQLKTKYGLSMNDLQRMLFEQNNCCKICGVSFSHKKFVVDHCHNSKGVRGLLCNNCNTALGKFKDNPELLRTAAKYLE